eukprot:SAG31_NODE_23898_length_493_cov_0.857868_2_plen_52_part_01
MSPRIGSGSSLVKGCEKLINISQLLTAQEAADGETAPWLVKTRVKVVGSVGV